MSSKQSKASATHEESVKPAGWFNRTVAGAGITSELGDFCYESTTVILPGFLAVLGLAHRAVRRCALSRLPGCGQSALLS